MNILFITHEKRLNGSSRSMLDIITELRSQHRFYVVSPYDCGEVIDQLYALGVPVITANGYKNWIQPQMFWGPIRYNWYIKRILYFAFWKRNNASIAKKIYKKIKKYNIDVVHTNTSVIDIGAKLAKLCQVPHIWHIREMGIEDFNLYPYVGWNKAYSSINANADRIICISEVIYEKVTHNNVDQQKCVRIYNGVGKEHINDKKEYRRNADDPFRVLVSGRICSAKRQDIAIEGMNQLRKRGYNNAELFIAGAGNIYTLYSKDQLPEYIHLLGQVERISDLRKKIDCEVICSTCEAFGRVTVEAMLSGLPVVASASGANPELIQERQNGLLYTAGNSEELADALEELILKPDLAKKMGKCAQVFAKEQFLSNRCAAEINAVYKELWQEKVDHNCGG